MPSSDFVDFIHRALRIPLGQSAKALVWRWRQICPLKIDIFTLSAPNSTNDVSMFKLAIEVCFENHFGFDSCYILIARVDQIRILFFGTPGILSMIVASAWELALALELASILHMYNEACKTDQGGYVSALYAIYSHCTANCICSK